MKEIPSDLINSQEINSKISDNLYDNYYSFSWTSVVRAFLMD